jgi:pyrimidine operon attenuation protein / uracil phosphoribosyltransferase
VAHPHAGTQTREEKISAREKIPADGESRARKLILSAADINRTVDRIAHQILEKTEGARDSILLGIPTRGAPLAQRLSRRIQAFEHIEVPVGVLDVTLYRDDLRMRGARAVGHTDIPSRGIDGLRVILVDDVLFSGRTVRAALDALKDIGRPRLVQLAVLVDRGHRELPIRADYVGKNIPTALTESVKVSLTEIDGVDDVALVDGVDGGKPADGARDTSPVGRDGGDGS